MHCQMPPTDHREWPPAYRNPWWYTMNNYNMPQPHIPQFLENYPTYIRLNYSSWMWNVLILSCLIFCDSTVSVHGRTWSMDYSPIYRMLYTFTVTRSVKFFALVVCSGYVCTMWVLTQGSACTCDRCLMISCIGIDSRPSNLM